MFSRPTVDIVIPVLNEEVSLPFCLEKLLEYIKSQPRYEWNITIADNGSTDLTGQIGQDFSKNNLNISYVYLSERGRGRALKYAWSESNCDVMVYMDVDLSTNLNALITLVDSIYVDNFDLCVGSRLSQESKVVGRKMIREVMSRGYNLLIKILFPFNGFSDAQCGFKGVSNKVVKNILPYIKDNEWFFDTELLLMCKYNSMSLKEIPVYWKDDPNTRVKIIATIWKDIKGLFRLRFMGFNKEF